MLNLPKQCKYIQYKYVNNAECFKDFLWEDIEQ